MLFALGASGLALLALPGLARPAGGRLHPAEWSKLCAIGVAGGALVVETAALLYAAPTLAEVSGIPALAHLCRRALGPLAPGGAAAGWTASAIAIVLPVLGAIGWMRARRTVARMRVEPWLGRHRDLGCPLARRSTATLRLALERWADEDAAAGADRDVLRRALLAVTASLVAEPALAAFCRHDLRAPRRARPRRSPPASGLPRALVLPRHRSRGHSLGGAGILDVRRERRLGDGRSLRLTHAAGLAVAAPV